MFDNWQMYAVMLTPALLMVGIAVGFIFWLRASNKRLAASLRKIEESDNRMFDIINEQIEENERIRNINNSTDNPPVS